MKKKPNGRPAVYFALGALGAGMWFIPHQIIADGDSNFSQNLGIFTTLGREMTVTAKVFGGLILLLIGIIYNAKSR